MKLNRRNFLKFAGASTVLVGVSNIDSGSLLNPKAVSAKASQRISSRPIAVSSDAAPASQGAGDLLCTNHDAAASPIGDYVEDRGVPVNQGIYDDGPPNIMDYQPERAVRDENGVLHADLEIKYADYEIYPGRTLTGLRSYNGQIHAPTWVLQPGDQLSVLTVNNLPDLNEPPHEDINHPHGFNVLNLHTHGLHVSPQGEEDNVLVEVHEGETFHNRYFIPENHPSGLYWYHPHKHGSAALQMACGMSGNLIIEGGADDLRLHSQIAGTTEVEMIFNQVVAIEDTVPENIEEETNNRTTEYIFTLNGLYCHRPWKIYDRDETTPLPEIHLTTGEVQHWRLTQAAIEQIVMLEIVEGAYDPAYYVPEAFGGTYNDTTMQEDIDRVHAPVQVLAYDGLSLAAGEKADQVPFIPGGRLDLLVQFEKPGTYTLRGGHYDQLAGSRDQNLTNQEALEYHQANGTLIGEDGNPVYDPETDLEPIPRGLTSPLPIMTVVVTGDDYTGEILPDIELTPIQGHHDITDDDIVNHRHIEFNAPGFRMRDQNGLVYPGGYVVEDTRLFEVNHAKFNPNIINHRMLTGTAEEWTVWSDTTQDHPFHIHVNPFQVIEEGMTKNDAGELQPGTPVDPPRWMDTVNIPPGEAVKIRHRFEDYSGLSVFHCHLIPHEDHGMMNIIELVDPHPATSTVTNSNGGCLLSHNGSRWVVVNFPPQSVATDREAAYKHLVPADAGYTANLDELCIAPALSDGLVGIDRFFQLSVDDGGTPSVEVDRAVTIEVRYPNPGIAGLTATAHLYRWNGSEWDPTGINVLGRTAGSLTCTTQWLGQFAVLYDGNYVGSAEPQGHSM